MLTTKQRLLQLLEDEITDLYRETLITDLIMLWHNIWKHIRICSIFNEQALRRFIFQLDRAQTLIWQHSPQIVNETIHKEIREILYSTFKTELPFLIEDNGFASFHEMSNTVLIIRVIKILCDVMYAISIKKSDTYQQLTNDKLKNLWLCALLLYFLVKNRNVVYVEGNKAIIEKRLFDIYENLDFYQGENKNVEANEY